MKVTRYVLLVLAAFLSISAFAKPVQAQSISVTNVAADSYNAGQKNTVRATVEVFNLPDGNYNVTIVVWDLTTNTSKTTTGMVVISNGNGSVAISADFPAANTGDAGLIQVEVDDPGSGTSGAGESDQFAY